MLKQKEERAKDRVIIFGAGGQDGSYLSELLLSKGYTVYGVVRCSSGDNRFRLYGIDHSSGMHIIEGDITDFSSVFQIMHDVYPHYVYNLAAQSHVGISFKQPYYTFKTILSGTLNILESIRQLNLNTKMYQASSSEMFGSNYSTESGVKFQDEHTPFAPCSPYAVAKTAAHYLCQVYRQSYGIWVACGILFNHESPRRGDNFVTKKITNWIHNFKSGKTSEKLQLGNLNAMRDWGYAPQYVEAMYLMLQQDTPQDLVIATGETHTVREFLALALQVSGLEGPIEQYVSIDENLKRPNEVHFLCGNASLAKKVLGWESKTTFKELVEIMVHEK